MIDLAAASREELEIRLAGARRHHERRGADKRVNALLLTWEKITICLGGARWPEGLYFSDEDLAQMAAEAQRAIGVAQAKDYDAARMRRIMHIHRHLDLKATSLLNANNRAQAAAAAYRAEQERPAA